MVSTDLSFRQATPDDSSDLFPIWSDEEVTKYTLIRDILTVGDCESRIERQRNRIRSEGGLGPFCAVYHGRAIGYFGATYSGGLIPEYEIFYNLSKGHWGKGFGTTIAKYLLSLIFDGSGVKRVVAYSVVENVASWKILENVGMTRIELIERDPVNSGRKHDLYKYEKTGVAP